MSFITDDASAGGVAQYNHSVLMALAGRGYQVTRVAKESHDPLVQSQAESGVVLRNLASQGDFSATLSNHQEIRSLVADLKPDLLFLSDSCPFSNFAAKEVALEMKIPFMVVEGFVAEYLAQNFARMMDRLEQVYRESRATVAVSKENLDLLHQHFHLPADVGLVVHYGRPPVHFSPRNADARARIRKEFNIPENGIVVVTTARLETVKGFQYQWQAIQQLRQMPVWQDLYFLWVGSGSMEGALTEAIAQLQVGQHVLLAGQRWNVAEFLDAADIYLLPSEHEGMPLAIMEAMAKRLPVVASAVSGIPEELGDAGILVGNPRVSPEACVRGIVTAVDQLARLPQERERLGAAAFARATQMFTEEKMVDRTLALVEAALLPQRDYVTPGFAVVRPDKAFVHLATADVRNHPWPYLRREIPHNWYCDRRKPLIGFASRDEASILYNTALQFQGKEALEIGCWMGWSACHLALGGVSLDVIDPLLDDAAHRSDVESSLRAAGVLDRVRLHGGFSPAKVEEVGRGKRWSLLFIDGEHEHPGPLRDTMAVLPYVTEDAAILFHDLASPAVAEGLEHLRKLGWNTLVFQTMQIMGIAWRGNVTPVHHVPDPRVRWPLPDHLRQFQISGMSRPQGPQGPQVALPGVLGFTTSGAVIVSFGKPK